MDRLIDHLADLGLDGEEAAAYLALLGRSTLTPTELAAQAGITDPRASDLLESLAAKRLCVLGDSSQRVYVAVDPKRVVESFGRHRAAKLERARRRAVRRTAALGAELAAIFQAGRGANDPVESLEILGDASRTTALVQSLAQATRAQVNACIKRPIVLTRRDNWRLMQDLIERGVKYRAVYEQTALADKELRGWMDAVLMLRQEIRLVRDVPVKMQSFDDAAVILAMHGPSADAAGSTAIVRDRGMVALLNLGFERLWDEGTPFEG
jgi:hypothetical protein